VRRISLIVGYREILEFSTPEDSARFAKQHACTKSDERTNYVNADEEHDSCWTLLTATAVLCSFPARVASGVPFYHSKEAR
jgi:hypothetical protein